MPEVLEETSRRLLHLIADAKEKFSSITEEQWTYKPAPGKWSRKEILGHLVDSAANNHLRFVRAQLAQKDFFTSAYEQDYFVVCQHYQETGAEQLIALWYAYNQHLAHVILHIDPAKLDVNCHIGNYPPVSLLFAVTDYLTHLQHHLAQILDS